MAFTVKEVSHEQKSVQEIEQELINQHEQSVKEKDEVIQLDPESKTESAKVDPPPVVEKEKTEVPDEKTIVLSEIKKRYNKEYGSVDDFFNEIETERKSKKQEDIPDDIQVLMKYKKETGRGIEDFIRLNREYDKEDPRSVIREFLSLDNQGLSQEDIEFEMKERYAYDEDIDDANDIRKKQIALKKDLSEALKYFNKQKEVYKTPLASSTGNISDDEKNAFEEFRKYTESSKSNEEKGKESSDFFIQKTKELFTEDFKGFEIKVNDKEFVYKPDESSKLFQQQSDITNFISKHVDKNNRLINAAEYHKALAFAMNPNAVAKYFYEQGIADAVTDTAKASKNIDMSKVVPARESLAKGGFNVAVVDESPFDGGLKVRVKK